jgi:hypothetical protein
MNELMTAAYAAESGMNGRESQLSSSNGYLDEKKGTDSTYQYELEYPRQSSRLSINTWMRATSTVPSEGEILSMYGGTYRESQGLSTTGWSMQTGARSGPGSGLGSVTESDATRNAPRPPVPSFLRPGGGQVDQLGNDPSSQSRWSFGTSMVSSGARFPSGFVPVSPPGSSLGGKKGNGP